jgi:hypothetical protein
MIMVLRWESLAEINPDPRRPGKYPRETSKKRKPASPWVMFRSCSMVGMRGAIIILDINFR